MTREQRAAIREWWATHETPKQAAKRFGLTTRQFWRVGNETYAKRKPAQLRKILTERRSA